MRKTPASAQIHLKPIESAAIKASFKSLYLKRPQEQPKGPPLLAGAPDTALRLFRNARISVMPETLKRHVGNDWLPTEATITACEQTLLGQESFSVRAIRPPEYRVGFLCGAWAIVGRELLKLIRLRVPDAGQPVDRSVAPFPQLQSCG